MKIQISTNLVDPFSYSDIVTFCREYVMKMGVCAEGAHIDIGLLPQELGCTSRIVILPVDHGMYECILLVGGTILRD